MEQKYNFLLDSLQLFDLITRWRYVHVYQIIVIESCCVRNTFASGVLAELLRWSKHSDGDLSVTIESLTLSW
jgi:hypothetical protein